MCLIATVVVSLRATRGLRPMSHTFDAILDCRCCSRNARYENEANRFSLFATIAIC
jgi:hypothetical protein